MSIELMVYVWRDALALSGTPLLTMLCLADHANPEGTCYPSVGRIAHFTRTSPRAVYRALDELEEQGFLTREARHGQSTVYHIVTKGMTPASITYDASVTTPVASVTPDISSPLTPASQVPMTPASITYDISSPRTTTTTTSKNVVVSSNPSETGDDASVTPNDDASVTESVKPFPNFAKARLSDITATEKEEWESAWRTVDELAEAWEPVMHLTSYLAYCKKADRQPNPQDWMRWFVQDEHKARTEAANAKVEDERDTRPWWE